MKTKFILLSLTALALIACDQKQPEASVAFSEVDLGENAFFLTTELPPEQPDGTPVPIVLRGVSITPVAPGQAPTPGTWRVIYHRDPSI